MGGGTFNTVQGLPSNYTVEYNPTSIRLVAMQQPLLLTSAVSRKLHGSAGPFDINLLLSAPVECRSTNGNHTLVFTFTNYLTSGTVEITTGTGTIVGTPDFSSKTVTVDLTGVADAQALVITLRDVTDRFSQVLPTITLNVGFLVGDTNGNRFVNTGDAVQTRSRSGQLNKRDQLPLGRELGRLHRQRRFYNRAQRIGQLRAVNRWRGRRTAAFV